MELILKLSDEYKWKLKISEDYTEIQDDSTSLNLDLIEIDKIREPYAILTGKSEVQDVVSSIQKSHFLHPIFVFQTNDNEFILGDGTHRIEALKQLGCNLIPVLIIKEEEVRRDAWVKILKSKAPHYKSIYKTISPNQRKNINHKEFDLLSIDSLIEYQYQKDLIAIYKDGKHVHIFSFNDLSESKRKEKLKLMKYFDDILDSDDKTYTVISKLEEEQFNFSKYLMIPPPCDSAELNILIKNKDLRRPKAFRIRVPMRMVHLPVPVNILKQNRQQALTNLSETINLTISDFKSIFLKLSFSKSLDISWYYHILLIGSKHSFLNDVDEQEKTLISQLLDGVKLEESESKSSQEQELIT